LQSRYKQNKIFWHCPWNDFLKIEIMRAIILLFSIVLATKVQASELFIRVNLSGTYYAATSGQTQYNNTNTFRFFDLSFGNHAVQIFDQSNNSSVLNTQIYVGQNQRVVAEMNQTGSLVIIQTIQISNPNWYTTVTSNAVVSTNGNVDGFSLFLIKLEKESFDNKKLEKAKKYIDKTSLSSYQINEIAKLFSFDNNRLDWAKYAYASCFDKANYFVLENTFTFSSNYRALEEYVETH
jgi:Domain of unknown function (DUF4476)